MQPYCVYILNSSIWVNKLFCFTARKWPRVTDWSLKVQVIKGPFLSHCPTPAQTAKARVTLQSQLSWAVQSYDSTALLLSRSLWDLLLFVFGKSGCSKWLLVFWFWHTVHTESACPQSCFICARVYWLKQPHCHTFPLELYTNIWIPWYSFSVHRQYHFWWVSGHVCKLREQWPIYIIVVFT